MPDSVLLAAFAAHEPARFAALLGEGTAEERLEVFTALEAEGAAAVAARLRKRELEEIPPAMIVRWIETGSFDDATLLLGKLGRHDAMTLIDAVGDADRRRRLHRFFVYPAHSLGSLASAEAVQISARTTLREVLTELSGLGDERERPVVVLDGTGRLLGALDLWKLLLRADVGGLAGDCVRRLPGLRPEISIESAAELPLWSEHAWLPLVDPEQRLLGVISRARLLAAAGPHRETVPIGEGIAELGSQLVTVSADVLGDLIGRDER